MLITCGKSVYVIGHHRKPPLTRMLGIQFEHPRLSFGLWWWVCWIRKHPRTPSKTASEVVKALIKSIRLWEGA